MTFIAGIDPGTNGAVAIYCTDTQQIVDIEDMPFWYMSVGKKQRKRVDAIALMELFDRLNLLGVQLVVMEAVGGRPRQSASAGFVFGYTVGLTYMAIMYSKIMIETVPPATWKKLMNVPGKAKAEDDDIMNRADELFPHNRAMFRGPKGGKMIDRAEAAMLAKFGGDHVLRVLQHDPAKDPEFKMVYRNAETGA
jgi:hypothetical protein